MYEDKSRKLNIDFKSLTIKMLILLGVLFIVLWVVALVGKSSHKKNESNLVVNLKTMQSAANEYFSGPRLPESLNGKKKITLQEMFDTKLLIEFKDQDNNSCDTKESYAEATKISDDNYTIKVKLICGEESDYVIDTVTIKTDNVIGDNTPQDDPNDDDNTDIPNDVPNNDDDTNNEIPSGNGSSNNGSSNNNSGNSTVISNGNSGSSVIRVSNVYINYKKIYLTVGTSKTVSTVIYPYNATNKIVTWSSSNGIVASVNNGTITGNREGTSVITASVDGKSTTMEVEVVGSTTTVTKPSTPNTGNTGNNTSNSNLCSFGTKEYNSVYTPAYLVTGNCAVSKNIGDIATVVNAVNTIGANEYVRLGNEIADLRKKASVYVDTPQYTPIYNNTNTGIVGYQIKFAVKVNQTYSSKSIYEYYLTTNGGRKVIFDNRSSISSLAVNTSNGNNSSSNNNSSNNTNSVINVTGVRLNVTNINLKVGEVYSSLAVTVLPSNATNKSVVWSSNNTGVASVDASGKITARGAGSATITARSGNYSATVKVTVATQDYINITATSATLKVGEYVYVPYSSNGTVTFTSSNSSVASVTQSGKVTALKSGSATIYIRRGTIEKRYQVRVNAATNSNNNNNSSNNSSNNNNSNNNSNNNLTYKTEYLTTLGGRKIYFNVVSPKVNLGSRMSLNTTASFFNPNIVWSSTNPSVVSVDQYGNVTGNRVGSAYIYAADGNYASSRILVQVVSSGGTSENTDATRFINTAAGRKIEFHVPQPILGVRQTMRLKPTANYFNPRFTYTSSDPSIVHVDQTGEILGMKAGSATITVTDGNYAASSIVVRVIN